MKELKVQATVDMLEEVTEFVNNELEEFGCIVKARMQIDIAIDELFSNIARYAYTPGVGEVTVRVERTNDNSEIKITFIDNGIAYNPLEKEDPDVTLSTEEREIGGLGIYMVKKSMDKITYEYKDGQNILSISKRII